MILIAAYILAGKLTKQCRKSPNLIALGNSNSQFVSLRDFPKLYTNQPFAKNAKNDLYKNNQYDFLDQSLGFIQFDQVGKKRYQKDQNFNFKKDQDVAYKKIFNSEREKKYQELYKRGLLYFQQHNRQWEFYGRGQSKSENSNTANNNNTITNDKEPFSLFDCSYGQCKESEVNCWRKQINGQAIQKNPDQIFYKRVGLLKNSEIKIRRDKKEIEGVTFDNEIKRIIFDNKKGEDEDEDEDDIKRITFDNQASLFFFSQNFPIQNPLNRKIIENIIKLQKFSHLSFQSFQKQDQKRQNNKKWTSLESDQKQIFRKPAKQPKVDSQKVCFQKVQNNCRKSDFQEVYDSGFQSIQNNQDIQNRLYLILNKNSCQQINLQPIDNPPRVIQENSCVYRNDDISNIENCAQSLENIDFNCNFDYNRIKKHYLQNQNSCPSNDENIYYYNNSNNQSEQNLTQQDFEQNSFLLKIPCKISNKAIFHQFFNSGKTTHLLIDDKADANYDDELQQIFKNKRYLFYNHLLDMSHYQESIEAFNMLFQQNILLSKNRSKGDIQKNQTTCFQQNNFVEFLNQQTVSNHKGFLDKLKQNVHSWQIIICKLKLPI